MRTIYNSCSGWIFLVLFAFATSLHASSDVDAGRIAKRDAILKVIHDPIMPSNTVSILKFGAKGDSLTDCKPAFDKAMKEGEKRHIGKLLTGFLF